MTDQVMDRRSMLGAGGAPVVTGMLASAALASSAQAQDRPGDRDGPGNPANPSDADILNFALNLEYLETEYYLRGVMGQTLDQVLGTSAGGQVRGGRQVNFSSAVRKGFMINVTGNELAHVNFIRGVNGDRAIQRPTIDFEAGFAGVAQAAGLGSFDPFADEMSYFLGSMLFEDVGVTAYKGSAAKIRNRDILQSAAGILATEAYHMGMVRSVLYKMGQTAIDRANRISDLRDSLDGPQDLDQPIAIDGRANIVPANENGIAFSRTPEHVLNIVYGNAAEQVMSGGFFPEGVNGRIHST